MKFSERKGYKSISEVIQHDGMDANLRNSLWNFLDTQIWDRKGFLHWTGFDYDKNHIESLSKYLWSEYFKKPIDSRPLTFINILQELRQYFFNCKWFEVYDFIECVLSYFDDEKLYNAVNSVLERELSGYRFVNKIITEIIDPQEIETLEQAMTDSDFPAVRKHLRRALELYSDRENPDYRNSIKESISAVESLAKVITGKNKAKLNEALSIIEHRSMLHPALKAALLKLYGYTSDEDGIRHAMLDESDLTPAEAIFFLITCTAFVNYLKMKI